MRFLSDDGEDPGKKGGGRGRKRKGLWYEDREKEIMNMSASMKLVSWEIEISLREQVPSF